MSDNPEDMNVFDQIQAGLQESIAHSKGEITLKTATLPAPRNFTAEQMKGWIAEDEADVRHPEGR